MRFVGEVQLPARADSVDRRQGIMVRARTARLKDDVDLDAVQADLASVIQQDWSPLTSRCGGTPAGKVPGAYGQIATRRST